MVRQQINHKLVPCISLPLFVTMVLTVCLVFAPLLYSHTVTAKSGDGSLSSNVPLLSSEHQKWLHEKPPIRIGVTSIPPQVLLDGDTGGLSGLCIDYLQVIENLLNTRFKVIYYDTWDALMTAGFDHQIDVIYAAQETPSRQKAFLFTQPYLEFSNKIVMTSDVKGQVSLEDLAERHVAVVRGAATEEYLRTTYPTIQRVPVDDELIGLLRVSFGQADAMVIEVSRASWYIHQDKITNLKIVGDARYPYHLRFACRNDWPELREILDSALSHISPTQRRQLEDKWVFPYPKEINWPLVLSLLLAGLVILIGVLLWNLSLHRAAKVRTSKLQQQEMQLAAIFKAAPLGIGLLTDRIFVHINDRVCQIVGYSAEELIGQNSRMLYLTQDDYDYVGREQFRQIDEQGVSMVETRLCCKDERIIEVLLTSSPIDRDDLSKGVIFTALDVTDRKRAEESLRETEGQLRTLIDNIPDCIARFDANGRYVFVNPAVLKTFAAPSGEFIGKSLLESNAPGDHPQNAHLDKLIKQAFTEGDPNRTEAQWVTSFGLRTFDVLHVPEKDESGKVVSVLGIAHDITERKQAEGERQSNLHFFESMDKVNRAMQGTNNLEQVLQNVIKVVFSIFECDRAWLLYPCDPDALSFCVPVEINSPEYPGAKVLNLEVPMAPGQAQDMRDALASESPMVYTAGTENPMSEETARQFGVQAQMFLAIYPKVGKPWLLGMHQCSHPRIWKDDEKTLFKEIGWRIADVLTSLLAYRDLRESENKHRLLFTSASDAIMLLGNDGFVECNPQAVKLFGCEDASEIISKTPADFSPVFQEDGRLSSESALEKRQLALEGQDQRFPWVHRSKDGSLVYVEVSLNAIELKGKMYIQSILRDVTQQRLAKIEQDRLLKELQSKNEELESIVFIASHDLRSPLVNIRGFAGELEKSLTQVQSLLANESLSDEARKQLALLFDMDIPESLGFINSGNQKMDILLTGLLRLSRIGTAQICPVKLDMDQMFEGIVNNFRFRIRRENVEITVENPVPSCRGDLVLVNQVFINLIDNAIKYRHPDRPANIDVTAEAREQDVVYCVKDNGIGIAPEHIAKVFEIFHRLSPGDGDGEGLGLTIVWRVLERQDGRVWIESEPDIGTSVYVQLPKE